MAVSHQWFIQWSAPSMVVTGINKQYQSLDNRWHTPASENWDFGSYHKSPDTYRDHTYRDHTYGDHPGSDQAGFGQPYDHGYTRQPYEHSVQESIPAFDDGFDGPYDNENNDRFPVFDQTDYEDTQRNKKFKHDDSTHSTALMLWLSMLATARPQTIPADVDTPPFSTLYKWKLIDFEFPTPRHRRHAIATGKFISENVLPLGLEVWGSRVWVTFPSWRPGVPATLATLPRAGGLPSPPVKPYPDWNFHRAFNNGNNCSGLISVFRVNADSCGRLWVLDSGQIDSQNQPKQVCPPSIVVFDLHTDEFVARYTIPAKYVLQDSLFSNIIVDSRSPNCSDIHVYIADTWRFGLLVFRQTDETFWRFSHHLFYPDPLASNYSLHGLNFQWADGIFGLALSPLDQFQERVLYFHSMSSYREFYVSTEVLRQSWRTNNSAMEFNLAGESRGVSGQASASAIDRRGVMFYGLVTRDSIGCWDTHKEYKRSTAGVVAKNTETLIFPNDIKVDQEQEQSVWVISNRLPMFQAGPLNQDDYNYRILFADVFEAVRGSVCDPEIIQTPALSVLLRGWLH